MYDEPNEAVLVIGSLNNRGYPEFNEYAMLSKVS